MFLYSKPNEVILYKPAVKTVASRYFPDEFLRQVLKPCRHQELRNWPTHSLPLKQEGIYIRRGKKRKDSQAPLEGVDERVSDCVGSKLKTNRSEYVTFAALFRPGFRQSLECTMAKT